MTRTLGIFRFLKITPCIQTASNTGFKFNEAAEGACSWIPRRTRPHLVWRMAEGVVTGLRTAVPGCDGWPSALSLLRALHHPVGVVSGLSDKNNSGTVASTDVLHPGVKQLLGRSGAAGLPHRVSAGVTARGHASWRQLTGILQHAFGWLDSEGCRRGRIGSAGLVRALGGEVTPGNDRLEGEGTHHRPPCLGDSLREGGEKTEVMRRPWATWGSPSWQGTQWLPWTWLGSVSYR